MDDFADVVAVVVVEAVVAVGVVDDGAVVEVPLELLPVGVGVGVGVGVDVLVVWEPPE